MLLINLGFRLSSHKVHKTNALTDWWPLCFLLMCSREVLQEVLDTDLSNEDFPFSTHKVVSAAGHQVGTLRVSTIYIHPLSHISYTFLNPAAFFMWLTAKKWRSLSLTSALFLARGQRGHVVPAHAATHMSTHICPLSQLLSHKLCNAPVIAVSVFSPRVLCELVRARTCALLVPSSSRLQFSSVVTF